ncbi:hypothetical protein GYMLUDRAFT_57951 [Collybiopsis luxurians FD-317 M1]|uniref:Uncharacterized protein n=1 Tax=Collybiopsis luxurians FD-317 M1 TaxID=944289 RepID=A0A0D0BH03_9AGAR|nr:hypothetical protein GYMLUDRAFT_57951 [Collybiopsis luxurians FD-317 M1]
MSKLSTNDQLWFPSDLPPPLLVQDQFPTSLNVMFLVICFPLPLQLYLPELASNRKFIDAWAPSEWIPFTIESMVAHVEKPFKIYYDLPQNNIAPAFQDEAPILDVEGLNVELEEEKDEDNDNNQEEYWGRYGEQIVPDNEEYDSDKMDADNNDYAMQTDGVPNEVAIASGSGSGSGAIQNLLTSSAAHGDPCIGLVVKSHLEKDNGTRDVRSQELEGNHYMQVITTCVTNCYIAETRQSEVYSLFQAPMYDVFDYWALDLHDWKKIYL